MTVYKITLMCIIRNPVFRVDFVKVVVRLSVDHLGLGLLFLCAAATAARFAVLAYTQSR